MMTIVKAALPAMKAAKFGRIVGVSSRGALGLETRTNYAATKAGMFGMLRTWALELGPHGVTSNCVAPGPVETDMFHEIVPEGSGRKAKLADAIPVGRIGAPEDIAHAVAFFLSPEAGFVTGQTLYVCGGTSIGSVVI
jgi:NAD(P)-dependent dehydrogenase (short-subunit alcohol dehydrogenase family)